MKKFILFILLVASAVAVRAQETTKPETKKDRKEQKRQRANSMMKQEEEGNLSFRKTSSFGIQLRTSGYGLFYELGRRKSQRFTNTYSIELTEIKHPKEDKSGEGNFFSNPFIYGKIINFYQVKLGYGQQYILGQKGNKNGVAVIALLQGGLDLGLAKPYYLHLQDNAGKERTISYFEDSTNFVSPQLIYGGGGFGKGFNEIKLKPGIYFKGGLRFDFGRFNESIQALEIGMSLEAFGEQILIMARNDPHRFYFQGHIAFVFGRRK